jgi:hypothetical protein
MSGDKMPLMMLNITFKSVAKGAYFTQIATAPVMLYFLLSI